MHLLLLPQDFGCLFTIPVPRRGLSRGESLAHLEVLVPG